MTITTAASPLSYSGDDSTVNFSITWAYQAKAHVVATLRDSAGSETVWVLDTDYTLTAPGSSGTLTATTAPATNETLVITSEPPNTQVTDIPVGGSFPASSVEDALDLASQVSAKLHALFNRVLRVPTTDTRSASQLEMPNETDRASKFLAFDANGDPIASSGSVDTLSVSTFMETVLDDTTAAAANTTLGLGTSDSVTFGAVSAGGKVSSTNATAGVGYSTGAGGTVTQATNRTTGVTLNTVTGAITLVSAAGSASWQTFTVTNSAVAATDVIALNQESGTDLYMLHVTAVAAGSFDISFATTGGTTTEQPVFNFTVIKGVTS